MEEQNTKEQKSNPMYLIPGAIVVAGALIAGAVLWGSHPARVQPSNQPAAAVVNPTVVPKALEEDAPTLGSPNAPVSIVEFGDFQCPFCGRYFKETEPQIIDTYVKTGRARFTFRNFSFLGQESDDAAVAALCANEQGKFWQYHDYLYSHQQGENQGAFAKVNLKQFAAVVGLNTLQFNTCLDSNKYLDKVQKDTEDGRTAGVSGTPTTFVNGEAINGAVPFSVLRNAIEGALAKASK